MDEMPEMFKKWAKLQNVCSFSSENEEKENVLRPDISDKTYEKEELMKNASHTKDGFFTAPKVIGNNDE